MRRLLPSALLALVIAAAAPSAQQKRPTFRANTQLVSVDVIVRDGSGAVVKGLTADDFEVTEDGKPQEIRSFTYAEISDRPRPAQSVDLLAAAEARLAADSRTQPAPAAPAEETAPAMTPEALAGR